MSLVRSKLVTRLGEGYSALRVLVDNLLDELHFYPLVRRLLARDVGQCPFAPAWAEMILVSRYFMF